MKKRKNVIYIGALLLCVFIVASILTFRKSRTLIEEGFLASEGNAAENFAVLTAENIHLTDAQVERLKQLSYAELLASPENQALWDMMDNGDFPTKVDYAYVMIHLRPDEVQYTVTAETADRFGGDPGTPLDIMWLLDVNVAAGAVDAGDELNRFACYIPEDDLIFDEKPSFVYQKSSWGNHICGYAPLYSTEGNYIGAVGVELHTGDYDGYRDNAIFALGLVVTVSLLLLAVLFLYIYRQYRNVQYERIYNDSLTGIYNRSYYNNRFTRYMNTHRTGKNFALMIADVDWFKKVNDTFGHEIGDEVLIEVAALLVETFGRNHVARFGGEEFVVGLWYDDETKLRATLDELYREADKKRFSTREIPLGISLGCCCYVDAQELNGWAMSRMLRAADEKLYECKENGRKQYRLVQFDGTIHPDDAD